MEPLIQVINKLQDVFAVAGEHSIDLPQIVVVGSQSSGKSSVLESLVGKCFLPRGTGIVTRAPLILQMIRYNKEQRDFMLKITKNEKIKEWAQFLHKPDTVYHNFDEVRSEIENRTDILAGHNKGITHEPIVLKVYTLLYDLTFVDLPGITKVPVGDQPEDIDEQIHHLILKYVRQPNSIILAVVTANTDPSTSESLQIARKIDPEGIRTVAVVTKLDLIDKGTLNETTQFLLGQKIPVKLGIIGVVNRSQRDIDENKSMKETLKSEKEFLKTNYPEIYKKHGNKMLASTLKDILLEHIKKTCPQLRKSLYNTKTKLENELKSLKTPDQKMSFVFSLLKDLSNSYCDTVTGNRNDMSENIIMGGAKISQIVNQEYVEELNNINPLLNLSDENINNILLNSAGTKKSSFVNEKALEIMISRQLKNLIEPSLRVVDRVCVEMLKIFDFVDEHILNILNRFPKLNTDVRNVLKKLLNDTIKDIKEFIRSYIETNQLCLNTSNPDFIIELIKSSELFQEELKTIQPTNRKMFYTNTNGTEEEKAKQIFKLLVTGTNNMDGTIEKVKQIKVHRNLTTCYFNFIRKNVRDFVPKRIIHKLVNYTLEHFEHNLHNYVIESYVNNRSLDQALTELDGVAEDRNKAEQMLIAVNKALKSLMDIQCI